jgi:glyoxylase-like metal-dependent hydrolase (beta-lactamase superfamily II)
MHAVHGKTLARPETNQKLLEIQKKMADNPGYGKKFLRSDPCIIREYAGGVPLVVVPADEELTGDRTLDLGDVAVELHYAESPHTDDALLVYVPDDKVLFVGDAQLGEFPTWFMNPDKSAALKRQVMSYDVRTVIDGHWRSYTKAEYLEELY